MAGKDKPKKSAPDPTVKKAKAAIAKKLEQTEPPLSVSDICDLCAALAKLTQAEKRQQEGEWGSDL